MVTKEKDWNGLTVVVQGKAGTERIGEWHPDYPDEWKAYWIEDPVIIDVHNNYYDVTLTPDEEKEILKSLDINDFVC